MTEWELGNRHAPDYVLFLMEYFIRKEGFAAQNPNAAGGSIGKEAT